MDVSVTETNKDKKSLIYDGYTYRIDRILKENDISCRCTNNKTKQTVKHGLGQMPNLKL